MTGFKLACVVLLVAALNGVKAKVFWETVESATESKCY